MMKPLFVSDDFERDEALVLMVVAFQDLSEASLAQSRDNLVPVCNVIMCNSGIITTLIIVAMIQIRYNKNEA